MKRWKPQPADDESLFERKKKGEQRTQKKIRSDVWQLGRTAIVVLRRIQLLSTLHFGTPYCRQLTEGLRSKWMGWMAHKVLKY